MALRRILTSFHNYQRKYLPFYINQSLGHSKCGYHIQRAINYPHRNVPDCNIIDEINETEKSVIFSTPSNYLKDVKISKCGNKRFNSLEEFHKLEINRDAGDYWHCNVEPIKLHGVHMAMEMVSKCNTIFMKNPSHGPYHWRDRIIEEHKENIRTDLRRNYQNIKTNDNELNEFVKNEVLSQHYYNLIWGHLFHNVYSKKFDEWKMAVWRMGGGVACIDFTQNPIKHLYSDYDAYSVMSENEEKQENNLFDNIDKIRKKLKCKVAVMNIQNKYHFCGDVCMSPNASEAHIYSVPRIGDFFGGQMLFGEHRINSNISFRRYIPEHKITIKNLNFQSRRGEITLKVSP